MQISSINNQNFKGFYIKKSQHKDGSQTHSTYSYIPFKDEKPEEIKRAIEKYDGKAIGIYGENKEYPFAIERISIVYDLGKLGITAEEYKKAQTDLLSVSEGEEVTKEILN